MTFVDPAACDDPRSVLPGRDSPSYLGEYRGGAMSEGTFLRSPETTGRALRVYPTAPAGDRRRASFASSISVTWPGAAGGVRSRRRGDRSRKGPTAMQLGTEALMVERFESAARIQAYTRRKAVERRVVHPVDSRRNTQSATPGVSQAPAWSHVAQVTPGPRSARFTIYGRSIEAAAFRAATLYRYPKKVTTGGASERPSRNRCRPALALRHGQAWGPALESGRNDGRRGHVPPPASHRREADVAKRKPRERDVEASRRHRGSQRPPVDGTADPSPIKASRPGSVLGVALPGSSFPKHHDSCLAGTKPRTAHKRGVSGPGGALFEAAARRKCEVSFSRHLCVSTLEFAWRRLSDSKSVPSGPGALIWRGWLQHPFEFKLKCGPRFDPGTGFPVPPKESLGVPSLRGVPAHADSTGHTRLPLTRRDPGGEFLRSNYEKEADT